MIPDFQTIMLPLLKFSGDGKEHSISESIQHLASEFKLTNEELNEWLSSKSQKRFYNYVYWAKAYLKMAKLLETTRRSFFKITDRGQELLSQNPEFINIKYLRKFPDFKTSTDSNKKNGARDEVINNSNLSPDITPEEQLELGYVKIRSSLEEDVLSKLKSVHPTFFERIVVE
ncbi:MAG: winged helix-turn-helix domain-containing protein, partial [Bacteroidota bacterium]